MANVKKGNYRPAQQWWKHLRKEWRKYFWHRERQAAKADIKNRLKDF